ncbi:hypothetical protein FCH28_24490 [Streptomyces piniterrae]|uniref:Secreted protein n=1 Tax=Streptomyces piniterrae TaxID=2571125 RepID=A0A4U0N706_9ACTN|nr:hypothetical protein [Streptomyces piniterrae]TJZ49470.1 hypothetical protein FCH28_24490 [Streptomyces piniterrae]
MSKKKRAAAIVGISGALLLATAPAAWANWTSSINDGGAGFESRRWADGSYSQLWWDNCSVSGSGAFYLNADVQYYEDISFQPDDAYDEKRFSACFENWSTPSMGEWHNLPNGDFYFTITGVSNKSGAAYADVEHVTVDTTAADQ